MRPRRVLAALLLLVLLVPAVALTLARLVGPDRGVWIRAVAFTPFALLLYGAALLVLLASWRARGWWRAVVRALVVVCVVGIAVHLLWVAPAWIGTPPDPSGPRIRVLTVNLLRGHADAAQVVGLAVQDDADIVVLEEVTPVELGRLQAAGISDAFPHAAGRAAPGVAGTMVFSSGPVAHVARLRTALGCYRLDTRIRGHDVHVVAVHLRAPLGDGTGWKMDHGVLAGAAVDTSRPSIVVGDFNSTTDHEPMRALGGRGYRDAATVTRARWAPTWPSDGQVSVLGLPVPSLIALDHVLVNPAVHPVRSATVTVDGTDHRGLLAILAL